MANVLQYLNYLNGQQDQIVTELERYTTIESCSRDKAGVDEVGRALIPMLEEMGFTIERIEEEAFGDHLVARRQGNGQGKLLGSIHLDTIWPRGTLRENPFRVENGLAFGPGIRDMKGGWIVLFSAIRALDAAGWDGLRELTIFMTGDEQLGSPLGRPWIEKEADDSDWVVVMEPARENGELVTSRGMVGAVYFDIHGIAGPATNRPAGASAILEAAHKIPKLEALSDFERGVLVSVGLVEGGTARQTVPGHAWLSIDLRATTQSDAEEALVRIREIADEQDVPGTRTVMSGGITRPAFELSPGTARMFALAQACGPEVGIDVQGYAARGGSDGCFTAAMGVPTLDGLGPEAIMNDPNLQEHVIVESIPRRAAMLAGVIEGLPGLLESS